MPPKRGDAAGKAAGTPDAQLFEATAPADGFRLEGAGKLSYVSEMFDRITPRYDLLNLLISAGQTTIWRLLALWSLGSWLSDEDRVLDVGCGTGWVTWFLRWRCKHLRLRLSGMDCSERMLQRAREIDPQTHFFHGDACALEAADASYDLVATVYTLRNFPDLRGALSEMVRVVRPGGTVVILDAFTPELPAMRALLRVWLNYVMPAIAGLFADRKAYNYLSASIQGAVPADEVRDLLRELGCGEVGVTSYSLGSCKRIVAVKAGT